MEKLNTTMMEDEVVKIIGHEFVGKVVVKNDNFSPCRWSARTLHKNIESLEEVLNQMKLFCGLHKSMQPQIKGAVQEVLPTMDRPKMCNKFKYNQSPDYSWLLSYELGKKVRVERET